jgi:hypothetical protein
MVIQRRPPQDVAWKTTAGAKILGLSSENLRVFDRRAH